MFYQLNKRPFIPILLLSILGCAGSNKSTPNQILWYEEPAEVWEEALPLKRQIGCDGFWPPFQ